MLNTGSRISKPKLRLVLPNRLTEPFHQPLIIIEVMQRMELSCKDLASKVEMAQIGTREVAAAITVTSLIYRARVAGEFSPLDAHLPLGSKEGPGPGISSWKDAVEEVIAAPRGKDQILRPSHAHEIARPILRQEAGSEFADRIECLLSLADSQPTHSEAVKWQRSQCLDALLAQILVHPSLNNAE